MIVSFSNKYRYFIYRQPCDMRKGIDGLSGMVQSLFSMNSLNGDVFICFIIYHKRLEKGTFELPKNNSVEITAHELQFILDGITLSSIKKRIRYEPMNVNNFIGETSVLTRI
jgi:transposase